MDIELLKTVGQFGGIAGIALGVILLFFHNLISQPLLKKLPATKVSHLLTLASVLVWSAGIVGLGVYAWIENNEPNTAINVNSGVGAGGNISGSNITITNPQPSSNSSEQNDTVNVTGGIGAGGDIENSHIEISNSKK